MGRGSGEAQGGRVRGDWKSGRRGSYNKSHLASDFTFPPLPPPTLSSIQRYSLPNLHCAFSPTFTVHSSNKHCTISQTKSVQFPII